MLSDCGFACLISGIMVPNGLTQLDLDFGLSEDSQQEITRHQATLLFEAVASSSSLETLWITANFEDLDEIGHILCTH